jgi:hypothetical protein
MSDFLDEPFSEFHREPVTVPVQVSFFSILAESQDFSDHEDSKPILEEDTVSLLQVEETRIREIVFFHPTQALFSEFRLS